MSNQCACVTIGAGNCPHCREKQQIKTALASPRGRLAIRFLAARISAAGAEVGLASPQGLATSAVQRADALIKELLK